MTVDEVAQHFGRPPGTIRLWIRQGCPTLELGSVGPGNGSRLDLKAVEAWRVRRWVPTFTAQSEDDVLALVETALVDVLKRDNLMGKTMPAEWMAGLIYARVFQNLKQRPLESQDLPADLARIVTNHLRSLERGNDSSLM